MHHQLNASECILTDRLEKSSIAGVLAACLLAETEPLGDGRDVRLAVDEVVGFHVVLLVRGLPGEIPVLPADGVKEVSLGLQPR